MCYENTEDSTLQILFGSWSESGCKGSFTPIYADEPYSSACNGISMRAFCTNDPIGVIESVVS